MKPPPHNTRTTVAGIAAEGRAIAVFAYAVDDANGHTLAEAHGAVDMWRTIADHVAGIGAECVLGDRVRVVIGDAQTAWYVRRDRFAIVAVAPSASAFTKSVVRMSRQALATMAHQAAKGAA